jgi:hypothetical protein|tara:strand:+ start:1180 stop:1383 length:204 start_codon:yes stop_codon:yes gene_type:complete
MSFIPRKETDEEQREACKLIWKCKTQNVFRDGASAWLKDVANRLLWEGKISKEDYQRRMKMLNGEDI